MAWWDKLATIGGIAAAPFTGGSSLIPLLTTAGVGIGAGYVGKKLAGGGGGNGQAQPEDPSVNLLKQSSERTGQQAGALGGMSTEALAPVLNYFKQMLGSDPSALMNATRQERGKVIDQYDTARRAIASFGPAGGGTTSALAESRFAQAESLADITSSATKDAAGNAAQLGTQLAGLGLSAEQLSSMDLGAVIQSIMQRESLNVEKHGQNMQALGGAGEALGSLLGLYLTRKGGAWERAGA